MLVTRYDIKSTDHTLEYKLRTSPQSSCFQPLGNVINPYTLSSVKGNKNREDRSQTGRIVLFSCLIAMILKIS